MFFKYPTATGRAFEKPLIRDPVSLLISVYCVCLWSLLVSFERQGHLFGWQPGISDIQGCTERRSVWSRSNMAVIFVLSREACLWTFSVSEADGYFVVCLYNFSIKSFF